MKFKHNISGHQQRLLQLCPAQKHPFTIPRRGRAVITYLTYWRNPSWCHHPLNHHRALMPPVLHMLDVTPSAITGGWGCDHVDTDHADETLVSISPLYLPLQLSDPSLQSLHGGGRGLLLCYPGEKSNSERLRGRDSFVHILHFPDSIPLFTICFHIHPSVAVLT